MTRVQSIRGYLLAWVMGLLTLSLVLFGVQLYFSVLLPVADSAARSEMQRSSLRVQEHVAGIIRQVEQTLLTARRWGQLKLFDHGDVQGFNRLFMPVLAANEAASSVLFAENTGREFLLLQRPDGLWFNRVTDIPARGENQRTLLWSGSHGLLADETVRLGYDPRTRPWYEAAMRLPPGDPAVAWTPAYTFFTTRDPGITAATHWVDPRTGRDQVLAMDVKLLDLSLFTMPLQVAAHGVTAILTRDGRLLGLPRDPRFQDAEDIRHFVLKTPAEAGLDLLDAALQRWRGAGSPRDRVLRVDSHQGQWVALFQPVSLGERELWVVDLAPYADFNPARWWHLVVSLGLLALMCGLTLLAARDLARRIERPLEALARESLRIGGLDLKAPVDVPTHLQEFRTLAEAQEKMRGLLFEGTRQLEEKVAALTRAEAELRESRENYRLLVESQSDLVVKIDPEGRLLYGNPALYRTFGAAEGELLGQPFLHHVHEDDRTLVLQSMAQALEPPHASEVVNRVHTAEGLRWFSWRGSALLDADGRATAFLAQGRDITDIKRTEEALLRAKEQAEAANRAKDEFLANMSHEIRTPLNGVLGMLQLLQQTALDQDQKLYADIAQEAGQGLLALLSDILDLSRLQDGRVVIRREPFTLGYLLRSVDNMFRQSCRDKGLEFTVEAEPGTPEALVGDEARIRQVLFNLVGNAVKFTEHGSVTLKAWAKPHADPQRLRLFFAVTDTGIGIPDAMLGDLFHPFIQADGSLARKYQGAGLGLSIVRRLSHLLHGGVDVESEAGAGTTMTFRLEVERGGRAEPPLITRVPAPDRPLRLLLVEDDRINRVMLKRLLEKLGHEAVAAGSGEEALEALAAGDFDCVLLDLGLPGLEATVRAARERRGPGAPRLPVVGLTSRPPAGGRAAPPDADLDACLVKPVSRESLAEVLERVLGVPRGGPAGAGRATS